MHVLQRFGAAFAGIPRYTVAPTCSVEGLNSGCWVAVTNVLRINFRDTGRSRGPRTRWIRKDVC